MSEINLLAPTTINGKTKFVKQPDLTDDVLILENPSGSGKLIKINSLSVYSPSSYSPYFFIVNSEFPYPERFKYDQHDNGGGNAGVNRWTVISKNEMLYLPEDTALWYHDTGRSQLPNVRYFTISYEEIS